MTRRHWQQLKMITLALGTGTLFGSLTCVQNVAETVGTGLALTGTTGLLGGQSQAAANLGANLELFADLVRLSPFGN